jgi:methionyl-tRNA synthetase
MPENKDTDFTWEDYVRRNNTELVGAMGNFIHRVLTFTKKNFGTIPEPKDLDEEDRKMLDALKEKMDKESEQIYNCKFKNGILEMMELCHIANRYFSSKAPWDTVKDAKDVCANTMSVSIMVIKGLAVMMYPYLPSTGLKLWKLLGEGDEIPSWDAGLESPKYGYELPEVQPLFKKMDLKVIQEQEATAGAEDDEEEKEGKPLISFEEFQKMDLRVGKIIEVLDHPQADKLYVMKVDLGGDDIRQIVAGLKETHTKDDLLNKQAAFVVNLDPVVLRGEKSEGMILAAEDDTGKISLILSEKEVLNGAAIK